MSEQAVSRDQAPRSDSDDGFGRAGRRDPSGARKLAHEPPDGPERSERVRPGEYSGQTVMWEAKAAPGRGAELVEYAIGHADPDAQVYRSRDDRVVVIDPTGRGLPETPAELMARPPHAWPFERVR